MPEPSALLVVEVTRRGQPAVTRFVCRLCQQYCQPMKRETAAWHLVRNHGLSQLAAGMAVEWAESEYQTLLAERQTSKALLDILGAY